MLRTEGALASRGEFRLDREKAREKLQKFRLKDPHHYVLEFVQAAHLLGAEGIDITIDADEMEMCCDGGPLSAEELEGIYDAPFSKNVDHRTRALRHLAIGLSSAQAMEPSVVQIEFTQNGHTTQLEVSDGSEQIREIEDSKEPDGARVYLREKFRASHLVDFFRNLSGDLAEKTALRDHCAHSPKEITLDGERISFGYGLPVEAVHEIDIETRHERGVIGLLPAGEDIRITILQNGVRVTEHRLPTAVAPAAAVIESDRLTKNLTQSAFIEDSAWHDFSQTVLPGALYTLLFEYIETMSPEEWPAHRVWFRNICAELFPLADQFNERSIALSQRIVRAGNLLEALPKLVDKLRQIPLWPAADEDAWHSMADLEDGDARSVGWVRERPAEGVDLRHSGPLLYFEDDPPAFFAKRLGERLSDLNWRHKTARERRENMELWRSRRVEDAPAASQYPYQKNVEVGSIRATIALQADSHRDPQVVFAKEGRLLARTKASRVAPRGLVLWLAGELPANNTFDGPKPNTQYIELVDSLMAELPGFIAEHHEAIDDDLLKSYLDSYLGGRLRGHVLRGLQVPAVNRLNWLQDHLSEHPDSLWGVPARLEEVGEHNRASLAEIDMCLKAIGAVLGRTLFETAAGQKMSLGELRDTIAAHGHINVVAAADDGPAIGRAAAQLGMEVPIVCADGRDLGLLELLFGGHLRDPRASLRGQEISEKIEQKRSPSGEASSTSPMPNEPKDAETGEMFFEEIEQKEIHARSSADLEEPTGSPGDTPVDPSAAKQPAPSPADRLLARLSGQIAEVCRDDPTLLPGAAPDEVGFEVDDHPAALYAVARPGDDVALAFLSTTTYAWLARSGRQSGGTDDVRFLGRLITYIDERLSQVEMLD